MKTIAELARENGVTPQTIYRKLNSVKQDVKQDVKVSLTENLNGITYITPYCEKLIAESLTGVKQVLNSVKQDVKQNIEFEEVIFLRCQNEKLIQELEKEREHSRVQAENLSQLSEQLVELTRNNQILLKQEQDRTKLISEVSTITKDASKQRFWDIFRRGR